MKGIFLEKKIFNHFILMDKQAGITSHDLVDRVREYLKRAFQSPIKCGHTGTLDKAACGLMMLMVGKATQKSSLFQGMDKVYETRARLGQITDTYDTYGEVVEERNWQGIPLPLEETLKTFEGTYLQMPPLFSAKKVNGWSAYRLVRLGKEVNLTAKEISVYEAKIQKVDLPFVDIYIHCSSGTYIRSLVKDWGDALKCGAHAHSIRRLKIGPFSVDNTIGLYDLEEKTPQGLEEIMIPIEKGIEMIAKI